MHLCSNAQQSAWVSQATAFTPVSTGVRFVSTVDADIVWICSYDGSGGAANRQDFSRTTDGGNSWTAGTIPVPTNYEGSMIHAVSDQTAWAVFYNATVGAGGGIWKTIDGGTTWNQQGAGSIFNANSFPNVVYFWDENQGFAMGDPNPSLFELYTTTDGGTTWTPITGTPAILTGEYGIVGHFNVIGDDVWFDTNKGRVYHSTDRGTTWTVASTGITVPVNGAMDICFNSLTNGLARTYSATGVNTIRFTTDGGATWAVQPITGSLLGSDISYVPGTTAMMVSTGAATGFTGTSFSYDGGLSWTKWDSSAQRTALGVVDSLTMWTGGFTTSPTSGGIYKYYLVNPVTCADPNINPGVAVASLDTVCPTYTTTITSSPVLGPTIGDFAGGSYLVTSADVSGTIDPLSEPSLIAAYGIQYPAINTLGISFTNNGAIIGGTAPYGVYYWTPLVFGNATSATVPGSILDLNFDINCVYSGNSVPVAVLAATDPYCILLSVKNPTVSSLMITGSMRDHSTLDVRVVSAYFGKANITVYDLTGRVVAGTVSYVNQGANTESINVANLATGTYVIKAEINGTVAVNKIVKM